MSNEHFYIAVNGQPTGPFTIEQIRQHHTIAHNTLVWNESMTEWTPASEVPELQCIIAGQWNIPNVPPQNANQMPPQTPPFRQQQPFNNYNQYQQPYTNIPPMPKTWLAESILATLFCCLPFGIVGIIKASKVSSEYNRGNYAGAETASREAGKWTKLSFFIGLLAYLLYIVYFILIMIGAINLASNY